MKVAVVGSGGREHAICTKLKESKKLSDLFCIPGNAGIESIATCVDINVMDFNAIVKFCKEKQIDLCFVAPDDPLSGGLVDKLQEEGIRAFGPNKNAAIIEGSKAFSKDFMKRNNIPTAAYEVFDNYNKANEYLNIAEYPLVIKADGLALGKGVIICNNINDAKVALNDMMLNNVFGNAGHKVVVEEFMEGMEVSLLVFTDGTNFSLMPSSQDHKKAFDNDMGLNTGGMGAFTPSLAFKDDIKAFTVENIVIPTINGMKNEGRKFKGVIYVGLMLTSKGVKVLEYNARFGDPETQAVLPLLKTDFLDIIDAIINEKLNEIKIEWANKAGIVVVLASGGYPSSYKKGYEIKIGNVDGEIKIFHSGTKNINGILTTNGGRVLGIAAMGEDIFKARDIVYKNIPNINFTDMFYRKDIGLKT